jgi:hypothetical protein
MWSRTISVCIGPNYRTDKWSFNLSRYNNFPLWYDAQTGCGTHSTFFPVGIGGSFSGTKVAWVWRWTLTTIWLDFTPQTSSGHVAKLGADKFIFTFSPNNTNSTYSENMALKQTKLIIYFQHTKIIYTISILLQPIFLKITWYNFHAFQRFITVKVFNIL